MRNLASFIYPDEDAKDILVTSDNPTLSESDTFKETHETKSDLNSQSVGDNKEIMEKSIETKGVQSENVHSPSTKLGGEHLENYAPLDTGVFFMDTPKKEEDHEVRETPQDIVSMAPGAQLRHLREQQGLSAQNVADRLCLNIKMIQLLEADKYNELPPPIFVRGYIRNYSKVLDISSDTLIETFNRLIGEESAPFLTPQLKQKNQTSSEDSWFKALTFTIIIALMILMALWRIYPNNSPTQTASTENNGGAITLPLPSTMDGMPGEEGVPPVSEGDSVPAMGLPGISSTVPPVTPMTPDVLASMSGISSSPPGIPPTLSTTTTPVANPIAEANSATAGMDGMGGTKTSPPDPNTLVLSYKNSSWTRVTDSTNKKVYEGVPKSGSSITVTGTPPFKVRVGVTAGVIANYQGKELDLATHTERDGRSFLIGSSTPAKPVE